jgi:hypothetical protein
MISTYTKASRPRKGLARSVFAVLTGLVLNAALSLGADQVFHELAVYPPWGEPMRQTSDNVLALSYRIIFALLASYAAGRLAPFAPLKHALVLGGIALVLSAIGAYVGVVMVDLGPAWYPLSLVVISLPCAWFGGVLAERHRS